MLDGVPLGQLCIEGINNNDALSLTIFAAVTFTPDLPRTDTNPTGHRPRTCSLDSAPMLLGGGSMRALDDMLEFTSVTDHDWTHPGRQTSWRRTTRHSRRSYHHCPHLHLLPSPRLDAGQYTVPPQVGNLHRRPRTTPVNHRLLLESGRDVSPTNRDPLNQEENICRLCRKPSKRRGTPH